MTVTFIQIRKFETQSIRAGLRSSCQNEMAPAPELCFRKHGSGSGAVCFYNTAPAVLC